MITLQPNWLNKNLVTHHNDQDVHLIVPIPTSHSKLIIKLVHRRLLSFYRDKTDLMITFGQAPLLAIAFFLVFQNIITVVEPKSFFIPLREYLTLHTVSIIIFLAVLTAVWFGSSKAIVEIPSSKILYQQERLSFLSHFDFLISILIALTIITLGQVFLFSFTFHLLFVFLPAWVQPYETGLIINKSASVTFLSAWQPKLFLQLALLLWLTAIASITVAMFISVFTPSRAAANAILPFLLILQILFAGSVIKPVIYMNPFIHGFANIMVSRWGFESAVLLVERDLNLLMPRRHNTNDSTFASFSFNYGLKKLDTKGYVSVIVRRTGENLNHNPGTSFFWRRALKNAADTLKLSLLFGEEALSQRDSRLIDELEKVQWDIGKLHQPIPPRLLEEAKKQLNRLYIKASERVLSQIDNREVLTEKYKKIWEDIILTDPRLKLFRRVQLFQIDIVQQEKLEKIHDTKFQMKHYRVKTNSQITWAMLLIITMTTLSLSWLFMIIKNDFISKKYPLL